MGVGDWIIAIAGCAFFVVLIPALLVYTAQDRDCFYADRQWKRSQNVTAYLELARQICGSPAGSKDCSRLLAALEEADQAQTPDSRAETVTGLALALAELPDQPPALLERRRRLEDQLEEDFATYNTFVRRCNRRLESGLSGPLLRLLRFRPRHELQLHDQKPL